MDQSKIDALFAQAPVAIALLEGRDHRCAYANDSYRGVIGGRDPVGRPLLEVMPELAGQPIVDILDGVYTNGTSFVAYELPIQLDRRGLGALEELLFTFSYQPYRDVHGDIVGVAVFARDVTHEVRTRREAEASAAEFSAIVQSIPDAVYVGDASGIRYCNRAALASLGFSQVSEMRRPIGELLAVLDARSVQTGLPVPNSESGFLRALEGSSSTVELAVRNVASGEERIVRANYAPVLDGESVVGAISVHTDITERMRLKQALEASEAFKQRVIESSTDSINVLDAHGHLVWINEGGQRLMEVTSLEDTLGRSWTQLWTADHRVRAEDALSNALAGHTTSFLGQAPTFAGTLRWWDVIVSPLSDINNGPRQVLTVARDITLRKELEDRRERVLMLEQQARLEAEKANRIKDDFIATVSHELRTPLSAILGWARLLGAGKLSEEKQAQAVQIIERNAKAQAQLIEDLLDVSRILSGKLRLEVIKTEPLHVIEAALDVVRPAADAKGVQLTATLDPHAGPLMGDPDRLQQVAWNLLTNAVKFTPKGGHVQVRLQRRESSIELVIEDTGRGIEAEFLPFVFEKFRQAEGGASKTQRGLGLGLSIVKYLVEAHGGTIQAHSAGVDQGSRFSVRLPVSPLRDIAHEQGRDAGSGREGMPAPFETDPALRGLRVLVVDDEEDARALVSTLLEQARAVVSTAADVDSAFALFVESPPDVLISDIGMPGATGYELIRKIRQLSAAEGREVPAVALTAYARSEDRMRALAAGFNMHVPKPIEPAELLVVIGSLVARQHH